MEVALEIQKFQDSVNCNIPQAVGAIDKTHIEINSPTWDSKIDYFNRKQRYSINTQAVVDSNLKFLDIATGYSGGVHDARILRDSGFYIQAERNILLTEPTDVIDGYKIRPLLIGNRAYPANTWLVKPSPNNLNLSQEKKKFNRCLSSARVAIERAFGILKTRWRYLLNCLDHNIKNISDVIISCCVIAHYLPDERRFLYRQWWRFRAYFTTGAGEKDSKKRGTWILCICQYVTGHSDGLCKCW